MWRFVTILLVAASAQATMSQSEATPVSNADVLGQIAADCIGALESSQQGIQILPDPAKPFMLRFVTAAWSQKAEKVYVAAGDSTRSEADSFSYVIDAAEVAFSPRDRSTSSRAATLQMSMLLTSPQGEVLSNEYCSRTTEDLVPSESVSYLHSPGITDTSDPERPGIGKRILEPVAVLTAVVTVISLFFTIRSNSN